VVRQGKDAFDIDIEHRAQYGCKLKIIAAIEEPAAIAKTLTHVGWSAWAPPRSLAQRLDMFRAA